jgi:DNA-binding MarR family transcriptional regulator
VFWPYAFGDYFSYAFWPYDYYDTFWGYGPDVIVWSAFWPYGEFDDYDYADDDVYAGDIYRPYRRRRAAAPPAAGGSLKDAADTCGNFAPGVSGFPVDRLEKIVDATEEQRKELEELKTASAKAAEILKNGCTAEQALTPVARLDAIEKRLQAMQEADEIVQEPLIKLYDLFSPAQKQRLEAASSERPRGQRPVAHDKPLKLEELCSSQADFTKVPADRISEQITLTEEQKRQLENLKKASADASDTLKASCPATVPDSFDGRLDAAQKRVTSLIQAIDKARPPIKDFYASLTDEQKAALSMQARPGQTSANNHG